MKLTKAQLSEAFKQIASKAGKASAASMTPKQRTRRARKAALARWRKP